MTVILVGQRSDGTPLVLVRCDCCGEVTWTTPRFFAGWFVCECGKGGFLWPIPTLAQADRERAGDGRAVA